MLCTKDFSVAAGTTLWYDKRKRPVKAERKIVVNSSPKMHRPTAILAAILMSLNQILNIAASLSARISLLSLLGNAFITILLVVILFRGKRDTAAGVMLLVTLIAPLLSVGFNLLSVLAGFDQVSYAVVSALSAFVTVVFRGLWAVECLSKGNFSASGGRVLLWMLPALGFLCGIASHALLCLYNGMTVGDIVLAIVVYVAPQWLAPILMGVSLSIQKNSAN